MDIIGTTLPIFAVILIGWIARRIGVIPEEFSEPANRLVFYLAIPAMIFRSVAKASLTSQLHVGVLAITLSALLIFFGLSWAAAKAGHLDRRRFGTFMQCSFHGNLGYIGFAVSYYFLGEDGLAQTGIIGGFTMIMQNFLAVIALNLNTDEPESKKNRMKIFLDVLANPVIVAAITGIVFSAAHIRMPLVISRTIDILSDLALPMALLLIGASLTFDVMRHGIASVMTSTMMKLVLLPGVGFVLYRLFGIGARAYLPGLILLASPTATISFVMAQEMNGDTQFAVSAISASTVLSAITISLWLNVMK